MRKTGRQEKIIAAPGLIFFSFPAFLILKFPAHAPENQGSNRHKPFKITFV
jgi:hypothetical protein